MIGYICAWLRYYHTGEFIATYLNCAANEDDITKGTALAQEYGIKISPPRFGFSKDVYVYDKDKRVISKGIESIKFMNKNISNELYALKDNTYLHFIDVLLDIRDKTSVDARQLDFLIKIDFFVQFGNCVELSRIRDIFTFFGDGTAKSVKKEKIKSVELQNIVSKNSTDKKRDGSEAKSFTITNMYNLLISCENYIKSLNLQDLSYKVKCANQQEILGYIDLTTGKEVDRRKLLISRIVPLGGRDGGEPWAYALFTKSVGSGKSSRLTLKTNLYKNKPIHPMDIIYAKRVEQNSSGYWYLWDYEYVVD